MRVTKITLVKHLLGWTLCMMGIMGPATAAAFDQRHTDWDGLLQRNVAMTNGGVASSVHYQSMLKEKATLERYLASLSALSRQEFDGWPKHDQLAFLINAYNAWTVELVLSAYPKLNSIKDLGNLLELPWKRRFIPLLGGTRSLDDIEQGLIRGSDRYGDPRIHFAVNCASIGCPALRPEAYTGDRLDRQLEDATAKFLADRTRNRFDRDSLKVSSIFKWYRSDFEKGWHGAANLGQFLSLYRQSLGLDAEAARRLAAGKIGIDFLDYDWRLNAARQESQP